MAAWSLPAPAEAGDWAFHQSYYSHLPAQQVPIGPRAVGGPFYSRPAGAYVRSGYRNINSTITGGGSGFDQIRMWESWVQYGSQF